MLPVLDPGIPTICDGLTDVQQAKRARTDATHLRILLTTLLGTAHPILNPEPLLIARARAGDSLRRFILLRGNGAIQPPAVESRREPLAVSQSGRKPPPRPSPKLVNSATPSLVRAGFDPVQDLWGDAAPVQKETLWVNAAPVRRRRYLLKLRRLSHSTFVISLSSSSPSHHHYSPPTFF